MQFPDSLKLTCVALASLLAACGGGGGGSGADSTGAASPVAASSPAAASGTSSTSTPAPDTLTTPQYAANSAQAAMFTLLNTDRQECGFPALQENTILDQAAAAHAQYDGLNNVVSDTEVATNPGFTGVDYLARAVHFGFPSTAGGGGVSGGFWTTPAVTETQYGQYLVNGWLTGVYHAPQVLSSISTIGIGEYETTVEGAPEAWGTMQLMDTSVPTLTSNGPLTFPCQGVTNVSYSNVGETPTPPNTSGPWGTPVTVLGNSTDTIVLLSGTMTGGSGGPITLQLLDSANDPNKELQSYQAVAYPTSPLTANTTYNVAITGTYNGTAFSRTFSFTTGNSAG